MVCNMCGHMMTEIKSQGQVYYICGKCNNVKIV